MINNYVEQGIKIKEEEDLFTLVSLIALAFISSDGDGVGEDVEQEQGQQTG